MIALTNLFEIEDNTQASWQQVMQAYHEGLRVYMVDILNASYKII